ncbi:MAG: DUF4403 family protein [Bacteroidota bacterium]
MNSFRIANACPNFHATFSGGKTLAILQALVAVLLFSGGCRVLKTEKPHEEYSTGSFTPRYSYINIPFETDVKTLKKLINRELSGMIYSDTSFEDHGRDNLKLQVVKSDSITIGMDGNQVTYRVPLKVWLRKRFSAGLLGYSYSTTQDANAEVALKFKTTLSLNKDWSINTITQSDGFEWISYPRVLVGLMEIPLPFISDLLVKSNMPVITREIDLGIRESLNLRPVMTDAWVKMQKPILVSPENSLWLKIVPAEISTVPIRAAASAIVHPVSLKALVQLFFGTEPGYPVDPTLPPLKITSSIPDNFSISLSMDMPFSRINEMAKKLFTGYVFSYRNYKITVLGISVYGQGENLIVALVVEGSVKGTIYLSGIPVFDGETRSIVLSNLDFQVSTRNALIKTASWMFHSGLVQKLSSNLVYPVGDRLQDARRELNAYLQQNQSLSYFRIKGEVDRLDPDRILITPEAVKAWFRFEGKIRVGFDPGKLN